MELGATAAGAMGGVLLLLQADFLKLLYLIPILLWIGAAAWVLWDSLQRAGEWGWLWGFAAFVAAPLIVPLYLIILVIVDRPAPAWVQREAEFMKEQSTRFKAMGELERAKFLEAAAGKGGTLYSPGGLQPHERGTRHFVDAQAEHLLETGQHEAAFVYLYDLYCVAASDKDIRGEQTYRHYIAQLPTGLEWLKQCKERGIGPVQLKAGGLKTLESFGPPRRSQPEAASPETGHEDVLPLTNLLEERELSAPRSAMKPMAVQAARDPRLPRKPTVPF